MIVTTPASITPFQGLLNNKKNITEHSYKYDIDNLITGISFTNTQM